MMSSSSAMHMLFDALISSRCDLILFVMSMMGYMVLCHSRNAREAKQFHKKVDTCETEVSQVDDTDGESDSADTRLAHILESMESIDTDVPFAGALLDAFFEDYPKHPFTLQEVRSVLNFCSGYHADKALANRLRHHMGPTEEWDVLSAFMHFYLDTKQPEEACDVFELNYATFFDIELDDDMEWRLLVAASACGRQSLAEHLLQTSQSGAARRVMTIQRWWRRSSPAIAETRVANMGDVLNRLSNMFHERYPFEEQSDGESTCFLGEDSDWEAESDSDSTWEDGC